MSGPLESLGRKIAAAGDLGNVVRSMKALSAASIGQYEKAVLSLDQYYRTVELGLSACLREIGPERIKPVGNPKREGTIGVIVFGSDLGLVGRFNEMLVEFVVRTLGGLPDGKKRIWAVGERIGSLLESGDFSRAGTFKVPISVNAITPLVGRILIEIEAAREKGEFEAVYLFHHRQSPGIIYEPVCRKLLPLDEIWQRSLVQLAWPTQSLPEVVGGAVATLQAFIRSYFFVLVFQACAESLASENASCLASMQRAEKNIEDIVEGLSRAFHRIRQESIDEELFDVIAGYEALFKAKEHVGRRGPKVAADEVQPQNGPSRRLSSTG